MLLNEHISQTIITVLQIDDLKSFLIVKNSIVDKSLCLQPLLLIPKMIDKQVFSLRLQKLYKMYVSVFCIWIILVWLSFPVQVEDAHNLTPLDPMPRKVRSDFLDVKWTFIITQIYWKIALSYNEIHFYDNSLFLIISYFMLLCSLFCSLL